LACSSSHLDLCNVSNLPGVNVIRLFFFLIDTGP
jgi:hypothetical protein